MDITRRDFLKCAGPLAVIAAAPARPDPLHREVGITTSSLAGHLVAQPAKGKFTLLELPRILRNELDMRIIDLNTSSLASTEPEYLDRVRQAAADAGCVLTNLKLNQRDLDMNSADAEVRERALREYRRSLDAASRLGLRWARPLPLKARPDLAIHVASYRALADYAAPRKIQLLVENFGWMESEARSVVRLVEEVGRNVAACPDTGNWASNEVRYQGLALTFPGAVTCDFKARELGPEGQHTAYDLKRCFTIGWEAGFRGPWCLEHGHADRAQLFRELALLRDSLRRWMREQKPDG
jgi:hypothetical protein